MKKFFLSKGEIVLIDDEDLGEVMKFKWRLSSNGYAVRTEHKNCQKHTRCQVIHMHRFILKLPEKFQVDHKDKNKLNNQKRNLRPATNSQNQMNRGKQKNNTSGFKGVSYTKRRSHLLNPWQAKIHLNNKTIYLGVYKTAEEAASAYDDAAQKYHGEFAKHNCIGGGDFL